MSLLFRFRGLLFSFSLGRGWGRGRGRGKRHDFPNFALKLIILNSLTSKVFPGNNDQYTSVSHDLTYPIITRYIRIHPESWHNHTAMRAEFYGGIKGEN